MEDARQFFAGFKRDQLIFAGVLVVLGALAWLSFYLIAYQLAAGLGVWLFSLLAFLAFSVSVGLSFFLLRPRRLAFLTYVIVSLAAFAFFGWRGIEIAAVAVFLLVTALGYVWVRREQKSLIPFLYSRLLRRGLPIFFTGLAFSLALFYNTAPISRVSEVPQLSQGFIGAALAPGEYALRTFVPDIRGDTKISRISELEIRGFAGPAVKEYFSRLPAPEQEKTITEFSTDLINSQIRAIILPYKQFLPFVYFLGLFLVFRALAMPIMWLAMGMGWIVIKIMTTFGILNLRERSVQKQELIL